MVWGHILYTYVIRTFQKFIEQFDATGETSAFNIATTNSVLIMGSNFEVSVHLQSLLKPITSQEK